MIRTISLVVFLVGVAVTAYGTARRDSRARTYWLGIGVSLSCTGAAGLIATTH